MSDRFNLTPDEALAELEKHLRELRGQTDTGPQLADMTPDAAFDAGYAAAIFDYKQLTAPAPEWVK